MGNAGTAAESRPGASPPAAPVLVALSGGVDSAVAAARLQAAGHGVLTATLKLYCYGDLPGGPRSCCGLEGVAAARAVAAHLGLPHLVLDVGERFAAAVIDDFVEEYGAGRTPNPCARCNATVKLPDLLAHARRLGCERLATGHYARRVELPDGPALLRGRDRNKDQAFFLWAVPRDLLPGLLLPVGDLDKAGLREEARRLGLPNAARPESQEICFVPDGDHLALLRQRLGPDHPALQPGPIVDRRGREIGRHPGYAAYTVGQRAGLGGGHGQRLYVLALEPAGRRVVVGPRDDLLTDGLQADRPNWLAPPPGPGAPVRVQIRHRAASVAARVVTCDGQGFTLACSQPLTAVTPGQSAVLFSPDDERLLGGGRIVSARPRSERPPPISSSLV